MVWAKELSLCHNLWIIIPISLIFQPYIIWSNRIHSLKYLSSTTLESKDIGFRKTEFVAKTQFLCSIKYLWVCHESWVRIKKDWSEVASFLGNSILIYQEQIHR